MSPRKINAARQASVSYGLYRCCCVDGGQHAVSSRCDGTLQAGRGFRYKQLYFATTEQGCRNALRLPLVLELCVFFFLRTQRREATLEWDQPSLLHFPYCVFRMKKYSRHVIRTHLRRLPFTPISMWIPRTRKRGVALECGATGSGLL